MSGSSACEREQDGPFGDLERGVFLEFGDRQVPAQVGEGQASLVLLAVELPGAVVGGGVGVGRDGADVDQLEISHHERGAELAELPELPALVESGLLVELLAHQLGTPAGGVLASQSEAVHQLATLAGGVCVVQLHGGGHGVIRVAHSDLLRLNDEDEDTE